MPRTGAQRSQKTSPSKVSPKSGRKVLRQLLLDRNQYPDRVAAIDDELRRTFEREVAMLVLDMVGFSRLTEKHGIIHYLAMIQQMEQAATPAIRQNGGRLIKQEADNLFAIYPTPAQALESALDIFRSFDAVNSVVPADRDIFGSIGIGFGKTLVIGEEDLFGHEMNLASKLGEDLAQKSEILLTPAAYEEIPEGLYRFSSVVHSIGGTEVECHRFEGRVEETG